MTGWLRRRDRWEWAILGGTVGAVAVTALVAASAIRTRGEAHEAALASVTNYLAVALERYANGTETFTRQSFAPILPPPDYIAAPGQREPLPISEMVEMVDRLRNDPCQCLHPPHPSSFFRLGLSNGRDIAVDGLGHPLGAVDPAVAAAVRAQAESLASAGLRYGFITGTTAEGEQLLFFTQRTDSSSGLRFAYGMVVPVGQVADSVFAQTFATTRLVPRHLLAAVPRNEEFVSLEVRSRAGALLYSSGHRFEDGPDEALKLPTLRGGMVFRAHLNPGLKNLLLPGGVPPRFPARELALLGLALLLWVMIAMLAIRSADLARLRTDFASSVTHELRTPITQIRLAAETILLGRARDRDAELRALTSVVQETDRLQQLIDNVLHFSRAERRLTRVTPRLFELRPFVAGVVEGFLPLVAPQGTSLRLAIPEGLTVTADPDAVRQTLLNLLDNAARYGPAGQTITVGARPVGSQVELTVEDEGPGIRPADHARVWRPFVRLDLGSVTGTGLGLAVARELTEAQHGHCRIESRDGPGARVVVSLPMGIPA